MPNYRRYRVLGGTYFFTVNLLERYPNDLLISHVESLRTVVRETRKRWPFHIDYCPINPVKHGLVGRVSDWPYSSFHR